MKIDFVPVDEHGRICFDQTIRNLSADQANKLLLGDSSLPEFLKAILRQGIEDGEITIDKDNDDNNDDTPKVLVIAPNRLG